jgi:hypothetical protein
VAERFGALGVGALERLATALWVGLETPGAEETTLAARINAVKPHVSMEQARDALRLVDEMRGKAEALGLAG